MKLKNKLDKKKIKNLPKNCPKQHVHKVHEVHEVIQELYHLTLGKRYKVTLTSIFWILEDSLVPQRGSGLKNIMRPQKDFGPIVLNRYRPGRLM